MNKEIAFSLLTAAEIKQIIIDERLMHWNYAIIEGDILKDFDEQNTNRVFS